MIKYFETKTGIRVPAITTEQMIEVDRIAIEETGPSLFQMMENAGRNLALSAIDLLGSTWQDASIVVLAGTGGNGGGGICAARHLANRNMKVAVCISNIERLSKVPSEQRRIYQSTSGKEISINNLGSIKPDLIIDAIIGYSLKSAPRGEALEMITWANKQNIKILSLDVPSGINSTTGETYGEFIKANRTLTLALPKTGLLPELTGDLFLGDLGIPKMVYKQIGIKYSDPFGNEFIVNLLK
ncbi:MAG: NAD(P)H-hydrate epimerase [Melioribacteraceae bacterium]